MSSEQEKEEKTAVEEVSVDYTKHWKKYYENVAAERMKEVSKLAKENEFKIGILDEEANEWIEKTFKYYEVPTKKWMELETLRSQYNDLEKAAAQKMFRSGKDEEPYNFQERLNELLSTLYRKSALYFLRMSETDFDNSKWTQVKSIIDACNHRTIFTLPN